MASYSPPTNTNDNRKLADLVNESWHKADSLYPEIDFSHYNAFVIFHAGAGRDIDLVGSIGYNPTPFDIPSLFMDSLSGISVDSGRVFINNTIILPETETHIIPGIEGDDTLQLSINGLFAASIGSYLGLPDLFDTKTGRSGIGQFGLMDGASIFAYSGLFPPEPSAWEKISLDWTTPIEIRGTSVNISIPAVSVSHLYQDTIYKVPINESEYFLIENRNRDPQGNGQRLWLVNGNGVLDSLYFEKDTIGFSYYDVSRINGSIVDVEDYDWAIIGTMDGSGKYDGGGILIWHIDDAIISANRLTNTINADPEHRGIDLEEADGSQDIGESYEFLTPGSGTENGSPLDCWFDGNSASVYKNIFDRSSFPNSNSNTGALSLVTIKNFSRRLPRMTLDIEIGNSNVTKLPAFSRNLELSICGNSTSSASGIFLTSGSKVYAFDLNGQSKTQDSTGLFSTFGGEFGIAVYEPPNTRSILVGLQDSTVFIWKVVDSDDNGKYDTIYTIPVYIGQRVYGSPIFADLDVGPCILVNAEGSNHRIWKIGLDGTILDTLMSTNAPITSLTQLPTGPSSKPCEFFITSGETLSSEQTSITLPEFSNHWLLAGAFSKDGNFIAVLDSTTNRLLAFNQTLLTQLFDITLPTVHNTSLAIADIDGDGSKDIIVLGVDKLMVVNRRGVMLDGFPVDSYNQAEFVKALLIGDIDNDGATEIVCFTSDGRMWAYNRTGKLLDGYPIQLGTPPVSSAAFFNTTENKIGVLTVSLTGAVNAVQLQTPYNPQRIFWTQYLCNSEHTNADFSNISLQPRISEFLPKSRVYNWPNPVYGKTTQIRYYVSENASITVSIFDLAGEKITELKGTGFAGLDSEITWDVTNIQSGIYLARVEANSSGRSEVIIIKIAVVK
jgi:hypothetical protein